MDEPEVMSDPRDERAREILTEMEDLAGNAESKKWACWVAVERTRWERRWDSVESDTLKDYTLQELERAHAQLVAEIEAPQSVARKYLVTVLWQMSTEVEVEASSLDQACRFAEEAASDIAMAIPEEFGQFSDGSEASYHCCIEGDCRLLFGEMNLDALALETYERLKDRRG